MSYVFHCTFLTTTNSRILCVVHLLRSLNVTVILLPLELESRSSGVLDKGNIRLASGCIDQGTLNDNVPEMR